MEQKFCQSCEMPLTEEMLGMNADGKKPFTVTAYAPYASVR